ncbi:MAG: SDR family NAD(P)-dependent oxidoreductase [Cyanobacteriota bacterium]|nr:SDR family NAD(P)-dependent oxidoreductase [Cyanobacteriota bacterium]
MGHVNRAASSPSPAAGQPLAAWQGTALVVGCGGIGSALLARLSVRAPGLTLLTTHHRHPPPPGSPVASVALDLADDHSLSGLVGHLAALPPLRLVINTAGILHDAELQPEKRLSHVSRNRLERSFAVNAFGPLLLAAALGPLLRRDQPLHFASLSARVGSITDNRSGGWYSYRASKAAQNQLLRTLALEWQRTHPQACVCLLHPGTTATPLSQPFRGSVAPSGLFSPEGAADHLLNVLEGLSPAETGQFRAWDGRLIPW